jgi:hypothetical protein
MLGPMNVASLLCVSVRDAAAKEAMPAVKQLVASARLAQAMEGLGSVSV